MDELKTAIKARGGVSAFARWLGVSQSRVSNWLTRGSVPDGWMEVIRLRSATPAANDPNAAQAAEQGAANA